MCNSNSVHNSAIVLSSRRAATATRALKAELRMRRVLRADFLIGRRILLLAVPSSERLSARIFHVLHCLDLRNHFS